jgi:8-oxo-dGTP pyrophosphatase MutT (NUDIX family)
MQIDPRLNEIDSSLYRIAAKAIIVKEGRILLVKEQEGWWSLPGGGIDHGEQPLEALKRELSEELGVEVQSIDIEDRLVKFDIGNVINGVPRANLYYRATVTAEKLTPKAEDVTDLGWFSANELEDKQFSPSITGSTSEVVAFIDET